MDKPLEIMDLKKGNTNANVRNEKEDITTDITNIKKVRDFPTG